MMMIIMIVQTLSLFLKGRAQDLFKFHSAPTFKRPPSSRPESPPLNYFGVKMLSRTTSSCLLLAAENLLSPSLQSKPLRAPSNRKDGELTHSGVMSHITGGKSHQTWKGKHLDCIQKRLWIR